MGLTTVITNLALRVAHVVHALHFATLVVEPHEVGVTHLLP